MTSSTVGILIQIDGKAGKIYNGLYGKRPRDELSNESKTIVSLIHRILKD